MWMRVDDGLHAHRKTRMATRGANKRRDVAPMGLWVLAGSWSGRNNQAGWVPCDELDRFDDDWEALANRLVAAGFWWPEVRDGEPGYGFNDWGEWNNPTGPSASGTFGNHKRWHVDKGIVKEDCDLCPKEPDDLADEPPDEPDHRPDSGATSPRPSPRVAPDIGSDIAPDSHPTSLRDHRPDSLTRPDPTRAIPDQEQTLLSDESDDGEPTPDGFDAFWDAYDNKTGRKKCEIAYRRIVGRRGITAPFLAASATRYREWCFRNGKYMKNPLTWLHGEHWNDDLPETVETATNTQRHLQLARDLAERENGPTPPQPRQIGQQR